MGLTRRQYLSATVGVASSSGLAGCIGGASNDGDPTADDTIAAATFFVFGDVTEQVAGDVASASLLVPVGQHGHGWEPGPSVRADVRDADLLVHGMDGFQPWVDNVTTDLEADGGDVVAVDVTTGIDLLAAGGDGYDDEHTTDGEDEHEHDDGDHTTEHDDEHTGDGHDDEHAHGQGMDPHFWMDPLRLKDAVADVQHALADVDPDNEDVYVENADAFRADLGALHERIESTVADADTDVLLVAGHDSYQYFGQRYGIEAVALTNVSPDDRPTAKDIERAQEVIQAHDVEYVCADPLEPQQAATQLVEETDARDVLPLTAMPGLTDEWADEDWGYVDVVEQVNLPTLERALDA